jgi:hypothetical protein
MIDWNLIFLIGGVLLIVLFLVKFKLDSENITKVILNDFINSIKANSNKSNLSFFDCKRNTEKSFICSGFLCFDIIDEARADEARADEARTDEARADEARADGARADGLESRFYLFYSQKYLIFKKFFFLKESDLKFFKKDFFVFRLGSLSAFLIDDYKIYSDYSDEFYSIIKYYILLKKTSLDENLSFLIERNKFLGLLKKKEIEIDKIRKI